MLQVCYALILVVEMLLGIYILHCLYPNCRGESKWFRKTWIIAGYIVSGFLFVIDGVDSFISNLSILFFALLFSALYSCFFEVKFLKAFLIEVLFLISISFLKIPVLVLEGIIYVSTLAEINRVSRTLLECVWLTVLMIIIIFLIKKKRISGYYKNAIRMLVSKETGLVLMVTGAQWFLLSYGMRLGRMGYQTVDFIFSVVLIFCIFFCLHYLVMRVAYKEVQLENGLLDISRRLLQKQNDENHKVYKKSSSRLHEYNHTLRYLYFCITEKRYDEARKFLSKYIDVFDQEKWEIWTGLPFLDFILNYKKQAMDKQGIAFKLELDIYEYPFADAELGILLGNLLDNAIEACEKCVPGKREIYLRIWNIKYTFMLHLINSSSKCPELKETRFVTDKADKNTHGLGVEQVKRIVEKYGGDISFEYSGEHFETKIIVPVMKEEKE